LCQACLVTSLLLFSLHSPQAGCILPQNSVVLLLSRTPQLAVLQCVLLTGRLLQCFIASKPPQTAWQRLQQQQQADEVRLRKEQDKEVTDICHAALQVILAAANATCQHLAAATANSAADTTYVLPWPMLSTPSNANQQHPSSIDQLHTAPLPCC
jgi:hypothetical protein